jgi:hypothetical protein
MLHYKAVKPEVLELIKSIRSDLVFQGMRLAGGTALALQLGHRISVDIDLFGHLNADELSVSQSLSRMGKIIQLKKTTNINIYVVNNIKVDIVNYPYHWLESAIEDSGIMLAGLKDIAAMKLAAIAGRGSKKDFIDIYFLLNHFAFANMIEFFIEKHPDGTELLVLKSLTWFEDADKDEMPLMLMDCNWELVKQEIRMQVRDYLISLKKKD